MSLDWLDNEYKKNLEILSTYLVSGEIKGDFNMLFFAGNQVDDGLGLLNCGTVGCAAGHGPYAGIYKNPTEIWTDYIKRVFGITYYDKAWDWCFAANWAHVDNTAEGAGRRIKYMLEYGVPENFRPEDDDDEDGGLEANYEDFVGKY